MSKGVKLAIVFSVIILFILIIISFFSGRLLNTTDQSQQAEIPTSNDFGQGGTSGSAADKTQNDTSINQIESEKEVTMEEATQEDPSLNNSFSDEQITGLSKLAGSAPIKTQDFEMGYSPLLNRFFIQSRTSAGDKSFREYLQKLNLTDVYTQKPEMFKISDTPTDQAISVAEQDLRSQSTSKTKPNKEVKLLTDILNTLYNFSIEEVSPAPTQPTPAKLPKPKITDKPISGGSSKSIVIPAQPWCSSIPLVTDSHGVTLQPAAMDALRRASAIVGHAIGVEKGQSFRSCAAQRAACHSICHSDRCPGLCAGAGTSYHQLGLAIDIVHADDISSKVAAALSNTGWCRWNPTSDHHHWAYKHCG